MMIKKVLVLSLVFFASLSCKKSSDNGGSSGGGGGTPPTLPAGFVKGADISWITQMESAGLKFYNSGGTQQECMALMKSLGMNTVRLRVWVNPSPAWNNAADVVAKAIRAKALGLRIMIDFHYSDSWADPGKQNKPAAWATQDFATLKASVATHTTDVLTQLKNNGVTPEWVQVGNETNNGMLWPDGKASVSMSNFAQLINAGYDAVKAVFATTKVIVHISNGFDNSLFRWMFDGLTANSAQYDIIGMSLYPTADNYVSYNQSCFVNMSDMVSRYGKPVMIVEMGMPENQPAVCEAFIADLIHKVKAVPNAKG